MSDTEFVYVTYIASTPEEIWKAITDANISQRYWGNANVSQWKPGSPWKHVGGASKDTLIQGEVVESVPPRRLVVTWAAPADAGNKAATSRVTFTLERVSNDQRRAHHLVEKGAANMVRLTVVHDRLQPGSEMARGITDGWPRVLSSLKSFLETGRPLNVWAA